MELLEIPLEEFKTHLLDRLKEQQAKQETPTQLHQTDTSEDPGALTIYLVCDPRDREAVEPIEAHLLDKGFEVNLSATEGDGVNVRDFHQDNLRLCDAPLIFYGVTTAMWLKSQLMELKKAFGFGRDRPYAAKAIYVSSPITPEKERFRTNDALVLRNGKGFEGIAVHSRDVGSATPAIPEPSTILLFGTGLAVLAAWRYRKSVNA